MVLGSCYLPTGETYVYCISTHDTAKVATGQPWLLNAASCWRNDTGGNISSNLIPPGWFKDSDFDSSDEAFKEPEMLSEQEQRSQRDPCALEASSDPDPSAPGASFEDPAVKPLALPPEPPSTLPDPGPVMHQPGQSRPQTTSLPRFSPTQQEQRRQQAHIGAAESDAVPG